ncbi:conjugative transposon protein TraM [Elizabethkingia meningoseptica]|uniref:conjugative transposon protein TraM n=1 Tax=Elizabethkingia meningoseptica TaxID=238 RepID=UPI0023AFD7EE|nr:conjugative transposon protein TraM [Elizabethkingia meningoseptica]MDE5437601.1 conjugative transposon protein TraM [Elizabethkingia meningoseptica]MDE5467993.1 conjugative transposon protein TraM [Elizabethkingia meningoseptica]MDE5474912.1 conjugative transposon protein TraM [Elizabethkingia meningoseptica]MDE5478345.1 conjugative transposon protein TraM [Elizabethkingia meningoseptica]MDE5486744.1 conjugative transposon protein TraM [Elizabethkingia meningoseptica]
MKENENKKTVVRVTEGNPKETADVLQDSTQTKAEKLKKPLIFGLMGIVFVGCMYLIFKPSEDKKEMENIGLNDAVPQATEAGMQSDKQKAYEQDMLEQKDQEKRNALTTLSDYWNTDSSVNTEEEFPEEEESYGFSNSRNSGRSGNANLNSYRNAQNTLGGFYQDNNSETIELRRQLDELKEQLAEKDVPRPTTVDDQLALMEKSYQMAAKYLPSGSSQPETPTANTTAPVTSTASQKEHFVGVTPARKNTVSALYREPSDAEFLDNWSQTRNRGFYTAGSTEQVVQPKNSIKACVHDAQTVVGETGVRLRLLEPAQTPSRTIPTGTLVTANAKFQGGRLQLKITSIELEGNIIPVDITIYDIDGQQGLYVPYSPEMNTLTEMAGNMSQTSGTSLMLTQNAGQQVAADLSRGVVQGISGYFAKKVRTPKVTLKAGHQVFLVSKK